MFRPLLPLLLLCLVGAARADKLDPDRPPPGALPSEIKLGEAAAKEFESAKTTKMLDLQVPANRALQDKVDTMARRLGAVSTRPNIAYSVKIVENKDINAFTLPGGRVYLFRGLIDFTSSDDELAGVVAHELGHNSRLHALRGQARAKKLSWVSIAAMAAMLAGGANGANVAAFSQYALLGAMNGYGVKLEREADTSAVEMMRRAGYNPSALVTFMERLGVEDTRRPEMELGIFATHPPSSERAQAIKSQMEREGLRFTPREVTGGAKFVVQDQTDRFVVSMNGLPLVELSSAPGAKERAQNAADKLNELWKSDLKAYEIAVAPDGALSARGELIARPSVEDAKLAGMSAGATGQKWANSFGKLFWRVQLNGKA